MQARGIPSLLISPPLQPSANCPDMPANNWLGVFIVAHRAGRYKSSAKKETVPKSNNEPTYLPISSLKGFTHAG